MCGIDEAFEDNEMFRNRTNPGANQDTVKLFLAKAAFYDLVCGIRSVDEQDAGVVTQFV